MPVQYKDVELFNDLVKSVDSTMSQPNRTNLVSIRDNLNAIFKDSKCMDVLYNNNTDKMFFGLCVMPGLHDRDIDNMITGTSHHPIKVSKYYIEIDSKIIEMVGLNAYELTACILHEVGHVVADASTVPTVQKALDVYLGVNDDRVKIKEANNYRELFRAGVADAIRKVNSIFYKNMREEFVADEFVVACGFGEDLESACRKMVKQLSYLNKDVNGRFAVLSWILNIYKAMKWRRIPALETLNKSLHIEPSELVKRNINSMLRDIKYSKSNDGRYVNESFKDFINDLGNRYKYNALSTLSDESYEYAMKVKNVDDDDEALMLLREINTRLSLIEEYMDKASQEDNKKELEKCRLLNDRYCKIRGELVKKTTYKEKYLGLFVQTPVIKSRYEM